MAGILKTVNPDGPAAGHFLSGQYDWNKSAEEVIVAAAAPVMVPGTVMGKITAGDHVPFDPGAATGAEVFAGILYDHVPDSAATQKATLVVRDQVVNGNLLTFTVAPSAPQLAALVAAAAAKGVIIRF